MQFTHPPEYRTPTVSLCFWVPDIQPIPGWRVEGVTWANRPRDPKTFFFVILALPSEDLFRWATFRWLPFRYRSPFRRVALPTGRPPDGSRRVALSASQSGPSEREAENAPGAPLLGAASRHTARGDKLNALLCLLKPLVVTKLDLLVATRTRN